MILVFPDGRIDGDTATDSELANTWSGDFLSYVGNVVHDVDYRFATLPRRQDRVIAGLSAGRLRRQRRPARSVGVRIDPDLVGLFHRDHKGVFAYASPATMDRQQPAGLRRRRCARCASPRCERSCKSVATNPMPRNCLPMVRALKAPGARVGWAIYRRGHRWAVWSGDLDQMLIMAGYGFAHPLAGSTQPASGTAS